MPDNSSRRSFLRWTALTGLASAISIDKVLANGMAAGEKKGLVFLFQGDSITDGNRGRNNDPNHIMGHGYAFSIASRIGADFAEAKPVFYNRGISGNQVPDLKKRWQVDALDLKPDVLSILIGINDTAALVNKPAVDENDIDNFETLYRAILQQSQQLNPQILMIIGLPFVYPAGKIKEEWEKYNITLARLSARIKKLALEFNAVLVDFPAVFDKAIKKAPVEYWTWDGIHPTVAAHELMAREWIRQVSRRFPFLKTYNYK